MIPRCPVYKTFRQGGVAMPGKLAGHQPLARHVSRCCRYRAFQAINFSIRIGSSRTRMPVAWYVAIVNPDVHPVSPISPTPRAPYSRSKQVLRVLPTKCNRRPPTGHLTPKRRSRNDSKTTIRRISAVLTKEESEDRQATQPGNIRHQEGGRSSRACRPILQASRITKQAKALVLARNMQRPSSPLRIPDSS